MKRMWKWVGLTIIVVLVAGGLLIRAWRAVPVEVKEMRPETFTVTIVEEGVVRAAVEYDIYPRYRDRVLEIRVEEGDRVEEGQVLMVLDTQELRYAVAELQGHLKALEGEELKLTERPRPGELAERELAIQQAEAQCAAAQREYHRVEELYRAGAVTDEEYHSARDRLVDAEYDLNRRRRTLQVLHESYDPPPGSHVVIAGRRAAYQAQIEHKRYLAEEYRILAPAAGVVGRLGPEEKEMVDPLTRLLTVFQDDRMKVEVDVLARDAFDLEIGMPVELSLDRRDREVSFPGTIVRIAPQAEMYLSPLGLEERRVRVTIAPDMPPDLVIGPGREVDATFITTRLTDRMVVPKRSLFTEQGENAVFVVEDGGAQIRRVITGIDSRRHTVVEQGLQDGDLVILNPRTEGLREGVRVQVNQHALD